VEKTGFSILRTDQQTTPMSPIQIGAIGKYRHYVRQEKGKNYDPSSSSPQTTWPIL
jgi:hypothetical protein